MATSLSWTLLSSGSTGTLLSPFSADAASGAVADIGLFWGYGSADLAIENNDIAQDAGLDSAVFLSLFTDRQANPGDTLPDAQTNRRGWWGDAFPTVDGDKFGSRLWLLSRAKQDAETLNLAKAYSVEALQWMIDDRVSTRIEVATEYVRREVMGITVTIYRPQADPTTFRYNYNWIAQEAKAAA